MLRNITAAQKCAEDFFKCDALAQTNQIMYDCLFCMAQKTLKKSIFSGSKIRNKNSGHIF